MRWVGGVAAVAVWTSVAVSSVAAQEVNLLLGGVHARYGDTLSGTAGVVGLDVGVRSARVSALGSMALSQFATGEWAWQANGRAIIAMPIRTTAAVGLLAGGSLNDFEGGSISGSWLGSAVLSVAHGEWVMTGQAGGGAARQLDQATLGFGTMSVAAQRALPSDATMQASVTAVLASGIAYADAAVEATVRRGAVTVAGGLDVRIGDLANNPSGRIRVDYAAGDYVTLQASAGRYAPDLVGFQEGLYGTVGLRLALTERRDTAVDDAPVRVESVRDSLVAITVRYDAPAQQVQIAGAWNGWQPVPMQSLGNDRWRVVLDIPSGIHEFSLIIDGDRWVVPDGAVTVPDGFGGRVAVVVVPGPR